MNAPDHDLDEPQLQDIAAWRRVRLGLKCMRRAMIGVVWMVPLLFMVLVAALFVVDIGLAPKERFDVVASALGICCLALIALYLAGLGLCCAAPAEYRIRRYAGAALALALAACVIGPWLVSLSSGRVFGVALPQLTNSSAVNQLVEICLSVMFCLSVILSVICVQFMIKAAAEALHRPEAARSATAFLWWFCLWIGSLQFVLLCFFAGLRDRTNPFLVVLASIGLLWTLANAFVLYCWEVVLLNGLEHAIQRALQPIPIADERLLPGEKPEQ